MRLIEKSISNTIFNSLKESECLINKDTHDFEKIVLNDFKEYLDDNNITQVTEEVINDYFTGMFYDIWDNDDLDSANEAESIIRFNYPVSSDDDYQEYNDGDTNWAAEEEAEATERMERRYGSMDESVKPKKEKKQDKRVIMQQGNVTCFKENENTYYVFENESDNEVEYNNQEDAMKDFLERCGVNSEAELKESLKEASYDDINYSLGEEYFDKFIDIENDLDTGKFSNASQEERDEMVKPYIEKFIEIYGTDLQDIDMYNSFRYVMEDNNWHTELKMIEKYINNGYKW